MARKHVIYIGIGLSVALLSLGVYEASRLYIAFEKTPAIRSHVLSETSIEIELDDIPIGWIRMLLKVEDPNFYGHKGIDVSTPGSGLTTLAQGMTKYLYFDNFQPGFAKIEQALIARFVVDRSFTKDEQLTIFFNTAYLGHKNGAAVRGFPSAARAYFGKEFLALSETEYLSLVAMLIAPKVFSVELAPAKNAQRVERIRMVLSNAYAPTGAMDVFYDQSVEQSAAWH